jgi:hypothetical protein
MRISDMNERIRELAEQAQQYAEYNTPQGLEWLPMFKERFAELIVRECRDIVSDNRDLAIEDGWNVDEAMSTAMFDIEEHFGVK